MKTRFVSRKVVNTKKEKLVSSLRGQNLMRTQSRKSWFSSLTAQKSELIN